MIDQPDDKTVERRPRAGGSAEATPTAWLWAILALSLLLNLWSIWFGLPDAWHPDESVGRAARMARDFSLNPHSFLYGSLHYYLVLLVIVPTYLVAKLLSMPEDVQRTLVYLAARVLAAVLGTGCVALTYLLARRLFDRTVALLAALLLALSAGFVTIAHFATVDVPMLFWMLASYLMSARVMSRGGLREHLLAGAFAGLAAGTKYVGGIAILTLVAAHFLTSGKRTFKHLLAGVAVSAVAFALANPPIFFASCEFFEAFVMDNAYNTTVGSGAHSIPGLIAAHAISASLAWPLAILAVASVCYLGIGAIFGRNRPETLFLASTLLPFFVSVTNVHYASTRHVLPLIPILLIIVAKTLRDLRGSSVERRWRRRSGDALMAAAVLTSAVLALDTELQFTFDGRNSAAVWVIENAAPGATIEVTPYGPRLPEASFSVQKRPFLRNIEADIASLKRGGLYQTLQPIYLAYKAFAEGAGLCEPQSRHYTGWYELAEDQSATALRTFDPSIEGLEARAPDLLIVSSLYYDRFADDPNGPDGRFFARLLAGETSYRQVAEFHHEFLPWLVPSAEFTNPTIRIFQRAHDPSADRSG